MSPENWPKFVLDAIGNPSARPRRALELIQSLHLGPSGEMTLIGIEPIVTHLPSRSIVSRARSTAA
jgi:hypothetical protein